MFGNNKHRRVGAFGSIPNTLTLIVVMWSLLESQNIIAVMSTNIAMVAVQFINEPARNNGNKRTPVTPTPLFVRLAWGALLPHDLDLWVRCYQQIGDNPPTNIISIGYSRTSEGWLDLLRDDQGGHIINEEQLQSNSTVNGIPPNTTCHFNVHLYLPHGGNLPVDGDIKVIQNKDSDTEVPVSDVDVDGTRGTRFTLKYTGEEITLVTAHWDEKGKLEKVDKAHVDSSDGKIVYPTLVKIATAPSPATTPSPGRPQ